MTFVNAYEDEDRARAYASLDFPGTYYLAFRDLPALISDHVRGQAALDFGCGAGRSTRFLRGLGFDVVGIDVSQAMIKRARLADPDGRYLLVPDGDYRAVEGRTFDLVLSAFAFDNIPGADHRAEILRRLGQLLAKHGRIILIGCTPDIYVHETVSFTTQDFPENRTATSGQEVRAVIKDVGDDRPVVDILWRHDDYLSLFAAAGLELVGRHMPLGRNDDPYDWVTEGTVTPWVIYVLKRASAA